MKFICSPISKSAMERLNLGYERDGDLVEVIIRDDLYDKISKLGFFNEINITLNKYIDDYEDEEITEFCDLVIFKKINYKYKRYGDFFTHMEKIIDNAINNKTGVFFFF